MPNKSYRYKGTPTQVKMVFRKKEPSVKTRPRNGKFAEKPGAYEQGFRISSTVLNPGDPLSIEQYFTGYGNIRTAKIVFYPSSEIFDTRKSYITHSIKKGDTGEYQFGAIKDSVDDVGTTFVLQGMIAYGWDENTLFIDMPEKKGRRNECPQIITETKSPLAPFQYYLKTHKNIKPGPYSVEFHFVYFNGDAWKTSVKKIDFKVQNFFEQYNKEIFYMGTFFALMAFLNSWHGRISSEINSLMLFIHSKII